MLVYNFNNKNMWKIGFDFQKFTNLMMQDIKKAFAYRDSFHKKNNEKKEYLREDLIKLLKDAGIKFSHNSRDDTLFKKVLDNNLI